MSWAILASALAAATGAGTAAFEGDAGSAEAAPVETAPVETAPVANGASDLAETETFVLAPERFRRLTVPVTIGGQGPFRFMIDTGAQVTVLSRDLANRLALFDRDSATLVAMASTRQVQTTVVPGFALGNREFTVPSAPILESAHIGGVDGILGIDSLQHQRVLFDFQKGLLQVADAADLGGNRGFDIVVRARREMGQLIIHRAQIDGVRVAVIIDTGAQGSIGNPELERRLRRSRARGEQVLTDVNGVELESGIKMARTLEMGRATISNLALLFAESPIFTKLGLADEPAMVLGMDELRLFKRVAIDFATREVLFDLPASASLAQNDIFGRASRIR